VSERDIPMKYILIGVLLFTLPLLALYQAIVGNWGVSIPMTVIMIVAGFLFVSVSAYMAGLVGSSNNPVSGLTICTILFAARGAGADARAIVADRRGRRDHDRRGGLLRGLHRRRQPAGPQVRATCRRDAVEAAADAGDRRGLERAGDGADAEPAVEGLRHRRAPSAEHPEPAARAAGQPDGVGGEGHLRRRTAVDMIGAGAGIGAAIIVLDEILKARAGEVPRAGARLRGRHLPAGGPGGADLLRRPARAFRGAPPRPAT
jgi:hypothetical protein